MLHHFTTLEKEGSERGVKCLKISCREMKKLEYGVNYDKIESSVGGKGLKLVRGFCFWVVSLFLGLYLSPYVS